MRLFIFLMMMVGTTIGFAGDVHIHGYGELHYNAPSGKDNKLDLHRFVIGLGYQFNDEWSFDMELDFEHAFDEPEFEFLHIDWKKSDAFNIRSGLILMPMGPLNQTHEPPLFFSVERPYVQKRIIPTTWQEPGVGAFGQISESLSYQAYIVSSIKAQGSDGSSGIRGWRSKGIKSPSNDFAFMGRLDYEIPGLKLGASLFTGGVDNTVDSDASSSIVLWDIDVHATYKALDFTAMYTGSSISGATELNVLNGWEGDKSIGEKQWGYYATLGYDLFYGKFDKRFIAFVRYENYDTQDGVPTGYSLKDTEKNVMTYGLAYYPFEDLVIKVDYEKWGDDGSNQFNLAIGFQY